MRSLARLRGTAYQMAAGRALLQLVADPDPDVREGAVASIGRAPLGITPAQLLAALDANRAWLGPALSWKLLKLVADTHPKDATILERLRTAARDPENGDVVLEGLTVGDPNWVLRHAREAVAGKARRARIVLAWLADPVQREAFLRALTAEPAGLRDEIVRVIPDVVADRSEQQRLTTILR